MMRIALAIHIHFLFSEVAMYSESGLRVKNFIIALLTLAMSFFLVYTLYFSIFMQVP